MNERDQGAETPPQPGVKPPSATSSRPGAEASPSPTLSPLRRAIASMEKMEAKLAALERARSEPIAIIGMGCRFPGGAEDPASFWRLLEGRGDAVTEVPADRWGPRPFDGITPDPGLRELRFGAFLKQVDRFDAGFFGISPREAMSLDPQQRLVLEVAWEALEHAGVVPERLMGSRTGVFLGMTMADYRDMCLSAPVESQDVYTFTGNLHCFPAGRLSYLLGLQGPSLVLDTACSSSLVAVHLACQSLRSGDASLALAGGVNLMVSPVSTHLVSRIQALSADGRCKTFDARANGFVRGEGCGIVLLKRLSDALHDGDTIWALIRGSTINQDGRSTGLTAPNVLSQQAMLRQALENARVSPADVSFVETHGTGTPLGDPIEIEALTAVLGQPREGGSTCALGAAKTNIGHLESAAGIAGLIKTALALRHQAIPPNLHFTKLNPRISLEGTPFVIPTERLPWPSGEKPRIAGVSSFGLSGTNAHVVLEEAPRSPEAPATALDGSPAPSPRYHLLPLSARSPEALRALAAAYARGPLAGEAPLADVCYSASVHRSHHEHRLAVVASSAEEMREALEAFLQGEQRAGLVHGQRATESQERRVFVFPGHGSQWLGMAKRLLEEEPVFRRAMTACHAAILREAGWSLLDELAADEQRSQLSRIDVIQPALFAIEVALAALWRSWGVEPDVIVGHSMGEVAAAHVAGALGLEDATRVICQRSKLLRQASGRGAMALVERSLEEAEQTLRGREALLSVAVHTSPRSVVISGDPAALEDVIAELAREGVFCRRVKADVAFHSPQMDPLCGALVAALASLKPGEARVPMWSTVTGELAEGPELAAPYWGKNLREPVRFSPVLQRLIEAGHASFVEMSPHPLLLPAVEDGLRHARREGHAVASLRRDQDDRQAMLEALGALYCRGQAVAWENVHPSGCRRVPLPTYPWQRERHWIEETGAAPPRGRARGRALPDSAGRHALLGASFDFSVEPGTVVFESRLSAGAPSYLADHRVHGAVVLPGAAYVEMALAAAGEVAGEGAMAVEGMEFERMLSLPDGGERAVQTVLRPEGPDQRSLQILSLLDEGGGGAQARRWVRHATATLRRTSSDAPEGGAAPGETLAAIQARCATPVPVKEYYQRLASQGLQHGERFQGIQQLWSDPAEALAQVRLPGEQAPGVGAYRIHPAVLDSCFQVFAAVLYEGDPSSAPRGTFVPVGVDRARIRRHPGEALWVHCRRRAPGAGDADTEAVGDLQLLDGDGELVGEISGLRFRLLDADTRARRASQEDWLYTLAWQLADDAPRPPRGTSSPTDVWVLLAGRDPAGAALAHQLLSRGERCVRVVPGERYARIEPGLYQVNPADLQHFQELFADLGKEGLGCRAVVHLWSLEMAAAGDKEPAPPDADQRLGCLSALHLTRTLLRQGWRDTPRLWLVSRGAWAVGGEPARAAAFQAPLWGLGRTLALEHPELRCACVDLSPARGEREAAALLGLLLADGAEDQVALREEGRYLARLARAALPRSAAVDAALSRAPARRSGSLLRPDGTYLITGGLGGLGLTVARWMVAQGARHLALAGRSGGSEAARAGVKELEAAGAEVLVLQLDVSQHARVAEALAEIERGRPPLRGIVHAAGVVDDRTVLQLDEARFRKVMGPKLHGAWNLHALTQERPLDFFVLYSSAASLLGSAGQANYAAANAFMDALAHRRRQMGLPALSINWGPMSEVGLAAAQANRGERLAYRGLESVSPADGLLLLERLLQQSDLNQAGVLHLNARQWTEFYPSTAGSPFWSELLREPAASAPGPQPGATARDALMSAGPAERPALLERQLGEHVARVLRMSAAKVDRLAPFGSMGLDSLVGLELRNRLEAELGLKLSATLLYTCPNVASLAEHILGKLGLNLPAAEAPQPRREAGAPKEVAEAIQKLDQDELLAFFDDALDRIEMGRDG
ncbi:type I polyketide synthase [Sorangium sp. So ce1389]|uniref:type I polyketide synthase n=1 Tax=Sorangium sp. So ce1389 TaxID=3133336 RepID=UPI003F5E0462